MAAVTQTVPTYLGGVSKQIDSKKKPGQVRECLNAYPDPTLGLIKRPGTKFMKTLATTSLEDAKWFYIHRDGDEQYIGRISKGPPHGTIEIWNAATGVECLVNDWSYELTVDPANNGTSGGSRMRNVPTTAGAGGSGTTGTGMTVNIYGVDVTTGAVDLVYVCSPGSGYSPGDVLKVTAADAGTATDIEFTITNIEDHYLKPSGTAADNPGINYDVLTVQDTTIITNKTTPILVEAAQTHTPNTKGTVRLNFVRYGSKYNVKINGTETADLITVMEDAGNATEVLNADDILSQLVTNIQALNIPNLVVTPLPSSIELSTSDSSSFTLDVVDDAGSVNLDSFQEQVNVLTDLPNQCAHGRLVKIINTEESGTAYWAKFKAEAGSGAGPGFWEETVDPNVSTGLLNVSMPHELTSDVPNVFDYIGIDWKDRLVGDDTTNSHPSFVNTEDPVTIQQAFLYNTRLGFLTKDNVSLSQAQDWYNFYYTSALTSISSDPIDLSCSSIRPAVLHGVVPTAQGLILFSKNQQFMMFAGSDGPLTPSSAIIRSISNYEMDTKIDPVDIGTNINFVSKTPSYSRIFGMQTRGYEESPIIQDISRAVSQWIPESIDTLFSSPQNSLTGVFSRQSDRLYLYRVYNVGEEQLMQSWFEWKLPGKIQYCTIDNDTMWLIVLDGTNTILLKASISKSTAEDIVVTSDGQQVNPHMDLFHNASSVKCREVKAITVDNPLFNTGYTVPPTVTVEAPSDPDGVTATATAVWNGTSVTGITITNEGNGYRTAPAVTIGEQWLTATPYEVQAQVFNGDHVYQSLTGTAGNPVISGTTPPTHTSGQASDGVIDWDYKGIRAAATAEIDSVDHSRCYLPYPDITDLNPVILIKGSGVTESGFTINPARYVDDAGETYFSIPKLNFANSASDVYVGYQYNFDVELPKTYYIKRNEAVDYSANLTIARMKFAVGASSGIAFKLKSKGFQGNSYTVIGTATSNTDVGTGADAIGKSVFSIPFLLKEENGIVVKVNGVVQPAGTAYTYENLIAPYNISLVSFNSGYVPTGEINNGDNTTTPAQTVEIYTDTWYDVQPVQDANQYLADDVPITEENMFTIPIHQRTDNFNLRVFSNSPFPVSLNSMMWEGQYSPRYYQRT